MSESIVAVRDTVDGVEKLKEDIGVTDPGWCSEMMEKIMKLDEQCKFESFSIPSDEKREESVASAVAKSVKEASSSDESQSSTMEKALASSDLGVTDPEWCSQMMEKITRLDENCKFEQFCVPIETPESLASVTTPARAQSMSSVPTPVHVDESISSLKSFNSVKEVSSSNQLLEYSQENVVEASHKIRMISLGSQSSAFKFFEYFESTQKASEKLEQALKDQKSHVIGLHGKRGSGKTALVTADKAKYKEFFDQVLFVTLPGSGNSVDLRNVQDQIVSQLKLMSFEEDISAHEISNEIKSRLEKENKVVVIFDNLSSIVFDPRNVGIPKPSKHCKLLWITHDKRNLTMKKCQHLIPLNPLSDDDAGKLIQKYSGIDDDDDSLQDGLSNVACEVATRCKGLPGLIQDVVSSLVRKDNKEYWIELLDSLKHSSARHQIFISFRGTDTRDNITYSLTRALAIEGFTVFKDDEQVRSGDEVSEALTNAIKQSRLSIVVLSENFAQSSWCLGELVQILQCKKDIKQRVLPVFYKVDPTDIRHLKGSFGKGMVGKEERFGKEKTQQWTSALHEIAGLSGKHYRSGPEYEFIQSIVEHVKNNKHCMYII